MKKEISKEEITGKKSKFNIFSKFWAVIYTIGTAAFLYIVGSAGILPEQYVLYAGIVVITISLIIILTLFVGAFKKSRKIAAIIISLLLLGAYGFAGFNVTSTLNFVSNITEVSVQTEDYHVVVKKDGPYEKVDDIRGKQVLAHSVNDTVYSEAKNELTKKEKVRYDFYDSLNELAETVIKDKETILFLSAGHYNTLRDKHKDFDTNTKVLYTVKVEVDKKDISKDVDVTNESFNVYISGLDTDGTIDTTSRSDVNMIATVNPVTKTVLLTSIPRDYYITLPGKGDAPDKLTHTGVYGINETIASVEKLLGIDINYYAKVNYTTVMKLVDAVGGINVKSDYTFTTSGMSKSGLSGITFYEGNNQLNGARALAFARERHSFPNGDIQRNKNQRKIVNALIRKTASSRTILTKYTSILNAIEDYVELNMSSQDIKKLVKMQLSDMASWKILSQGIKGTGDSKLCYSTGDYYVSVIMPDKDSIIKSVDKMVAVKAGQI